MASEREKTPERRRLRVVRRKTPARRLSLPATNLGENIRLTDLQAVFGWNEEFCRFFLASLTALDRDFIREIKIFTAYCNRGFRRLQKLPVVTVDSLDDSWIYRGFGGLRSFVRDELYIEKRSSYARATSLVLLDARYKGQPCVVKLLKQVNPQELIVETLINILMDRHTDSIPEIDSPKVYALCRASESRRTIVLGDRKESRIATFKGSKRREWVLENLNANSLENNDILLIQEKIVGVTFSRISRLSLLQSALSTLCKGLNKLQRKFNFSHRDFHSENVMYSKAKNKVYIIDFGYSCFSVPQTESSLQAFQGGIGWDQTTDEPIRRCKNDSHDLCTLLLHLYFFAKLNANVSIADFLFPICSKICEEYYSRLSSERIMEMKKFYGNKISSEFSVPENRIFHHWYVYLLYDIELEDFTPLNFLKRLQGLVSGRGLKF